jgi:hypothetical protein
VIEDASQAHGATYQGWRDGSMGDIGCFSLYYSKNPGAYGEAGICVSSDGMLAESLRMLRDHGSRTRYLHEMVGTNSCLGEMQAAVLRVKLHHLDEWNTARRAHAHVHTQQLQEVVEMTPVTRSASTHVFLSRTGAGARAVSSGAGAGGYRNGSALSDTAPCVTCVRRLWLHTRNVTCDGGCCRAYRLVAYVCGTYS